MTKKRITSFDVAEKSGVSRTTVSLVLNNIADIRISPETRQRVLDAAKELGYHPDSAGRKLASGHTNNIGLVLRQSRDQVFADSLLPKVAMGVNQAAEGLGFQVLLKALEPDNINGYIRLIQENHVDGIILSGPQQDDLEIINLYKEGFPIVLMGQLPGSNLPFVDIDAIKGSKMAVSHLIDNGHTRIGMITNASLKYTSAQQRHSGYLQALAEAGIAEDKLLLQEGNYTPTSGYEAMKKLLDVNPTLSAVFIASDVVAKGAMQAITEADLRIPKDVSVVGFDDIPLADYFDPPLTTVRIPSYQLGRVAGINLIHLIKGDVLEQNEVFLDSELIIRNSSALRKGVS
jgi:LacI family transcriptional regulator